MTSLFTIFLAIHVVTGATALITGTYVMIVKKGDAMHKRIGKLFAISILITGFSSFVLSILHPSKFLFSVGIFTIFMAATGWRYLYLKDIANGQKPLLLDWILTGLMFIFALVFVFMGIQTLLDGNFFGLISALFGWRGVVMAKGDYKIYKGNITVKNYWLTKHIQRMAGAYIATVTAFIVVNVYFGAISNEPWINYVGPLTWLLPAACLVPVIVKWTRKYQIKIDLKK